MSSKKEKKRKEKEASKTFTFNFCFWDDLEAPHDKWNGYEKKKGAVKAAPITISTGNEVVGTILPF